MLHEFLRKRMGVVSTIMLAAVFATLVAPYEPHARLKVQANDLLDLSSAAHLLGADYCFRETRPPLHDASAQHHATCVLVQGANHDA